MMLELKKSKRIKIGLVTVPERDGVFDELILYMRGRRGYLVLLLPISSKSLLLMTPFPGRKFEKQQKNELKKQVHLKNKVGGGKSPYRRGPIRSTRYKMERPRRGFVNLPYLAGTKKRPVKKGPYKLISPSKYKHS